jgi:hypothetical protein
MKIVNMELEKIKGNLCFYDKRNPDGHYSYLNKNDEPTPKPEPCYCDNCFNGRTPLAEELMAVHDKLYNFAITGEIST